MGHQNSWQELEAACEAAEEGILIVGAETGQLLYVNSGFAKSVGYAREELVERKIWEAGPFKNTEAIRSAFQALQEKESVWKEDVPLETKDGRRVDVALVGHVCRVGTTKVMHCLTRDISSCRRREAERVEFLAREQAARRAAEAATRAKDEFLALVSHELRTPLNAILGWCHLLRTVDLNPPERGRALEVIERNAQSQGQIIHDLLDISGISMGKLRLQRRPVDLAAVIKAALDAVRPATDAKDLQLDVALDPEVGSVMGDPNRLQQVVWNLLSNAIKFTPPGGRMAVRLDRVAASARITVSDTGQGIQADFLPYVFDPFRQAEHPVTTEQRGLGLGLAIVRHLYEKHTKLPTTHVVADRG